MAYKRYVGNGKYCYTRGCQRHAEQIQLHQNVAQLIDRSDSGWGPYYAGTEKKHFSDKTLPGSKFTSPEVKNLNDLLALAHAQRGSLEGNDAHKFIEKGIAPEVFKPGFRYLHIETSGKLGIVNSQFLDENTEVKVVRTKPGAPCNFMVEVDHQPEVDYGVVILEDSEDGKTRLITAFPGYPTFVPDKGSASESKADSLEGRTLTIGEIHTLLGRPVNVNTRLKS